MDHIHVFDKLECPSYFLAVAEILGNVKYKVDLETLSK
jgi:hypothetical protein